MAKVDLSRLKITVDNVAQNIVQQGLSKACLIVEADAKNNCPKDQGILANSITHEVIGNTGYVYSPLPYSIYVELGTGKYASDGNGRQTPWKYFYTGKKLSSKELEHISKYGYQMFEGKQGVWRTTSGMRPVHYLYNALNNNLQNILDCFK